MASPNEQFSRIARQGQEAVNNAVRVWADSVQRLAGGRGGGQMTDMSAMVDSAFDFAERVLQTQREFTKSVLQAVSGTTGRVTDAAVRGLDQTVRAGAGASSQATSGAAGAAESARQGAEPSSVEGAPAGRRGSRT